MKDGRTHLAHKAEHAVDMETGAIVAVTLHGADAGDTATIPETVAEAGERITAVVADAEDGKAVKQVSANGPREVVTDKGYHSRQVVSDLAEWGVRTYCSEPNRGRQRWPEQKREQQAVYANRRCIHGQRGLRLLRPRGEKLERWNQHLYGRGGNIAFFCSLRSPISAARQVAASPGNACLRKTGLVLRAERR